MHINRHASSVLVRYFPPFSPWPRKRKSVEGGEKGEGKGTLLELLEDVEVFRIYVRRADTNAPLELALASPKAPRIAISSKTARRHAVGPENE